MFVGAVGCNPGGLEDARFNTGSNTMVASSDYSALVVANQDHNSITRVDPLSGDVKRYEAGLEPTRVARARDRIFVTLRGERAVAVFNEVGGELSLETKIQVGAEPFGVVANEKGDRIYVASSLSYRVDEIDADGLNIIRSFPMPVEPRWLALHPSGNAVYVGSPTSPSLVWIDLRTDEVGTVEVPVEDIPTGGSLTPRFTGDMSVSPTGYDLAAPGLYVDNVTEITDNLPPPPTGYYGGTVGGVPSRLTPVLFVIPTGNDGTPLGEYSYSLIMSSRVSVNGYPASATFDPAGENVYTTIEAGGGVIATSFDTGSAKEENVLEKVFNGGTGSPFGFNSNPIQIVNNTGAGPRSIAFLDEDRAYAHAFIDNQITDIKAKQVRDMLESGSAIAFGSTEIDARRPIQVAPEVLDAQVAEGRRFFYSSNDPRMAAQFTGLSCSACHFDGRNDGLTFNFSGGGRQTPSLAGKISVTAPVRWQGDRVTVQEDAMRTSQDAMGGGAFGTNMLTESDLDAIAAYVDYTRDVDYPAETLDQEAIARGKAIFERTDVACSSCHVGERYTNNQKYNMFELSGVKTRPLTGVAATAPYLHDGRAKTLEDVLELSRDGSMGNTSMLNDQEMFDLAEYLRSL